MIQSKTFTKWAFRNGKREHLYGRLQFIPTIVGIIYNALYFDRINLVLFFVALTFQIIYLCSHHLEKFCFKRANYKPRG